MVFLMLISFPKDPENILEFLLVCLFIINFAINLSNEQIFRFVVIF